MQKRIQMAKLWAGLALLSSLLIGCSSTPNDVNLSVNQGSCVTGLFPGYESVATAYSVAAPMNANLGAQSPYCAAFTITNNNGGTNANNLQVNQTGLVVSYNGVNSTTATTYSMVDFNASGIPSSSFSNTVQQLANLTLFDPYNCVTTQGSKVNTLTMGGGSCTFYLQLTGESLPVGVYPFNLTVNYTNGNANYAVSATLNERANLYLGGNFSNSIAISNAQSMPAANTIISANSPESYAVSVLTRDAFGNVYSGDIFGNVFKYNGTTISSWMPITTGLSAVNSAITAMASDGFGNLYVANAQGQVAQITPNLQVRNMGTVPGRSPNSMAVEATNSGQALVIAAGNNIYTCPLTSLSINDCSLTPGPDTQINQMLVSNTISIATNLNIYQFTGSSWLAIAAGLPAANVDSLAAFNNTLSTPSGVTWYAGITESNPATSSVYSESFGADFAPLTSSSGSVVSGGVSSVINDAGQGVFVAGLGLASNDFSGINAYLAYIPSAYLGLATYPWTPITGISGGAVTTIQTASQLTAY